MYIYIISVRIKSTSYSEKWRAPILKCAMHPRRGQRRGVMPSHRHSFHSSIHLTVLGIHISTATSLFALLLYCHELSILSHNVSQSNIIPLPSSGYRLTRRHRARRASKLLPQYPHLRCARNHRPSRLRHRWCSRQLDSQRLPGLHRRSNLLPSMWWTGFLWRCQLCQLCSTRSVCCC
jgi:hypothetical protein